MVLENAGHADPARRDSAKLSTEGPARRLQWAEDTLARTFPVVWADIASAHRTSHPEYG